VDRKPAYRWVQRPFGQAAYHQRSGALRGPPPAVRRPDRGGEVAADGVGLWGESDLSSSYAIYTLLHNLGCRWFMPHPRRVVAVAVLSMIGWLVVVLLAR